MSHSIAAMMGLSGSGKSTTLSKLSKSYNFYATTASSIIRGVLSSETGCQWTSEDMRLASTDKMQAALLRGKSHIIRSASSCPVVLDCHAVIDKDDNLEPVPTSIFEALGVTGIAHLVIDPFALASRRADDHERVRPVRTPKQLEAHQNTSLAHARSIAQALSVPCTEVDGTSLDILAHALNVAGMDHQEI